MLDNKKKATYDSFKNVVSNGLRDGASFFITFKGATIIPNVY